VLNNVPSQRSVQDIVARRCDHASTAANMLYYHEDSSSVSFPLSHLQPDGSGVFSQESLNLANTGPRPTSGKKRISTVLLTDTPTRRDWTPDRSSLDRVQQFVERLEPLAQRAARGQQLQPAHRQALYEGTSTPPTGSSDSDGSSDGERQRVQTLRDRQRADESTNNMRIRSVSAPITTAGVSASRPPSSNHSEYDTQWRAGGANRSTLAPRGDANSARLQRGAK